MRRAVIVTIAVLLGAGGATAQARHDDGKRLRQDRVSQDRVSQDRIDDSFQPAFGFGLATPYVYVAPSRANAARSRNCPASDAAVSGRCVRAHH